MTSESLENKNIKQPTLLDVFIPIGILVTLLVLSVLWFGDDSSFGPNKMALLFAMGIAGVIGIKHGISISLGAVLILLAVGSLIGTWLLSGTVPTLIYYGLEILSPSFFYPASCIICGIVAMSIGSSWTTAATVGVALMGVANGMDLSPAIAAGAVVSGAYFGDKISPLSETTNLAPAVAGTDLFEHIRYMLWTTIPSFVITIILFFIIGLGQVQEDSVARIDEIQTLLAAQFNLSIFNLVPLVVLLTLAIRKMPAFPAVAIGALLGGIWAIIFQQELIQSLASDEFKGALAGPSVVWSVLHAGVSFDTGNDQLNDLLSGGGMASMLNTVWLIMCAMAFGAVLEKVGLLKAAVSTILHGAKGAGDMVSRTIVTCIGTNLITADQYMAIVMPGRMYKEEFKKRGLHQLNLSRSLEDGGTLTSPLIPWNTCGAYMHSVLLVNPFDYIFYAFFNLINPVLAVIYAYVGIKILRITPSEPLETVSSS